MWQADQQFFPDEKLYKIRLIQAESVLSFADVIQNWQVSARFRLFYSSLLATIPFKAIFWETPPVTLATVEQPFEFVAVKSHQLADTMPNSVPFRQYFFASAQLDEEVLTFENLGGDAMLVVPRPLPSSFGYAHLVKFLREAPTSQQHAFWQAVGKATEARLGKRPLWLNTSGLGVHWLHVRLDSHPKYYTYAPYKHF
ncbi:MAG: hypothetical protein AAF614_35320 [Chloroflexota bacterium]